MYDCKLKISVSAKKSDYYKKLLTLIIFDFFTIFNIIYILSIKVN